MKSVVLFIVLATLGTCYGGPTPECPKFRSTLPLEKVGDKYYYLETNVKANWYSAMAFCNLHKMRLASISCETENKQLGDHIKSLGLGEAHLWTSGTDLSEEGHWYWLGSGYRMVYKNWGPGKPDYKEHGDEKEKEHCLDVTVLHDELFWNDYNCHAQLYFICEA